MGISKQHFHILVTRDKSHFRHGQPHFKKPADGFMTKVMETKVVYTSTASKASPRQPEGVSVDREGMRVYLVVGEQTALDESGTSRLLPFFVSGGRLYGGSSRYCPTTTPAFPGVHASLYGKDNNWPNVLVPCQFGCSSLSYSPSSKRLFLGL